MIIVSKNKKDAFSTLQEAILSIDDAHTEEITVYIEAGIYEEKVFIRKKNIRIVGENRDTTIIRFGDGARKPRGDGSEYGTFNTAVILFAGSDIRVENLTIENSAGAGHKAGQALAVYIASDRTSFYNCRLLGHQDTIFTGDLLPKPYKKLMLPEFFTGSSVEIDFPNLRNYFKDCYIDGTVDFIFGPSTAYFDHCQIHSKSEGPDGEGSFITAASTPKTQEYGYVFYDCHLTSECRDNSTYLGRPWRDYAKTAFICCTMDNHIRKEGWHNWDKANAEVTIAYVEYGNKGPGADTTKRVPFSKPLINEKVLEYMSFEKVLAGEDNWNPNT